MTRHIESLLRLADVFNLVEITEADGLRYDALTDHITKHGCTLLSASSRINEPLTHQTLYFVAMGLLVNWFEGGAEAALTLSIGDDFERQIAASEMPDRLFVKYATEAMHYLAWDHFDDETGSLKAGKSLLKLARTLLESDRDEVDISIDLANSSYDLLAAHEDSDARRAQMIAYRLLVLPRHLPFLPDMPPTKFPPPILPAYNENILLELALRFIKDGVINQAIDLEAVALESLQDPDTAIKNQCQAMIDDEIKMLRIELALMDDLINFALEEDTSLGEGITADQKLRALLSILCDEKILLESFRDDDYGIVYQVAYLGDASKQSNRIDLCMKIESFSELLRINVGLSTHSVRANNGRDHAVVAQADNLVDHIRARVTQAA